MFMTINLSRATVKEYIIATDLMRSELSKNRKLNDAFLLSSNRDKASIKTAFITAFFRTYNIYAYYRDINSVVNSESLKLYCNYFGSPKDLQSFKLILSSIERFNTWSSIDFRELCLCLAKDFSNKGIQAVTEVYFTFLGIESPSKHGIDAFLEEYSQGFNSDYCRAALRKHYRVYAGLKAEHEYVIKPITLEVVKNAINYYRKLDCSLSN